MSTLPSPLFALAAGVALLVGFVVGVAFFSFVLRRREQRVAAKIKAIEAARLDLYDNGVELAAWVADLAARERAEAANARPRRWWSR
jgi:hypothetical protein